RGDGAPTAIALGDAEAFFDGEDHRLLRELRKKADEVVSTHRGSPPRAMALADVPEPVTPRVFIRGDPGNHGAEVPRRFLAILAGPERAAFVDGSGRLELARAIASADNPLTARVLVNRVWAQHFATGLVATPSDFGLRSDPPSDRALLDWLALRFIADGWSIKSLHRLILASATYQQASDHADADMATKVDPDNRLLWRASRRRLDFEALRDGLLAVAGALDPAMGGRAIDLTQPDATRRTVYGFIDRQNLANLFRTFDFASPDAHSPRRHLTSVPQQALYLMNSPFAVAQARRLARLSEDAGTDPAARIRRLVALVHAREATDAELALGAEYIAACARLPSGPTAPPQPVWSYGFGGLDPQTQRVVFSAFAFFANERWAPAASMPDERFGWVGLWRDGGHTGRDAAHAAIRRWTAPRDATIAIAGTLKRPETQGDGIAGRIVASGAGVLAAWTVATGEVATAIERLAVHRGDHIDFVVDACGDDGWDTFHWAPVITAIDDQDGEWKAAEAYAGPPEVVAALTPWEKYAQALLMSNEFAFID
ncbi:MAG: DUF1553 domain-containing protein, partial [Planctomycetes bacterium]|nr:DUF1553 domain-containing protein [Planctomycetota bacterium]